MVRNAYAACTVFAMPRVKEFDPEAALERAMGLFWSRGYEGTTLSHLLEEMGIRRQSLYDTFTDKRTLYLMVLERYRDQVMAIVDDQLGRSDASVGAIQGFFETYLAMVLREHRSCLMANASLELALHDEDVAEAVHEYLLALELALRGTLQRAQRAGELPEGIKPVPTARHLVNCLMGMSVMSRGAGLSRPAMRQLMHSALASHLSASPNSRATDATVSPSSSRRNVYSTASMRSRSSHRRYPRASRLVRPILRRSAVSSPSMPGRLRARPCTGLYPSSPRATASTYHLIAAMLPRPHGTPRFSPEPHGKAEARISSNPSGLAAKCPSLFEFANPLIKVRFLCTSVFFK